MEETEFQGVYDVDSGSYVNPLTREPILINISLDTPRASATSSERKPRVPWNSEILDREWGRDLTAD